VVPRRRVLCRIGLSALALCGTIERAESRALIVPQPAGSIVDRPLHFRWKCEGDGRYRIQIRREGGGVELTSDWRQVRSLKGECGWPELATDQLRLRGGTLPLGVKFTWSVQKGDNTQAWGTETGFQVNPIAEMPMDIKNPDWLLYGPGWNFQQGTLKNSESTGVGAAYALLLVNSSTRSREPPTKEIATRAGFQCGDNVDCRFGVVISSMVNDACRKRDKANCAAGPAPTMTWRLGFSSLGKFIVDSIDANGVAHILAETDASSVRVFDGYLRIMWRNSSYRAYVNGQMVACGSIDVRLPSNGDVYAGVYWKTPPGALYGSGLTIEAVKVLDAPEFTSPMGVPPTACWLPIPAPFEDWK